MMIHAYILVCSFCFVFFTLTLRQINAQGSQLLKMLLKEASSAVVPQQLVNQALHDKDRLKAEAFRAMCFYIQIIHNDELENEVVEDDDRHRIMKR